jgi:putative membrane protein
MREAAQSGLAEVQMGQLAQEKGQSQHIKQMGQMLVRDHQKANQELMMIASKKGMQLPTEMGAQEQAVIQRLNSASGSGFDQLAATENMRAHQEVIRKFQAAQQKVQDPELKAFIEKTLPVLQTHLDHARQAQMQQSDTAQGGADSLESQPSIPQHGADRENPTPQPTPGSPTMDQDQADKQ